MLKNMKINLKKTASAALAAAVIFAAGCEKEPVSFDYANEDLSSYVTLPDIDSYTRDSIAAEYQKALDEAEKQDSYILQSGSYFDFYVTAYIKNGDDLDKYEKFCYETYGSPVSGYRVLKESANADFDRCLMASIVSSAEAAVQPRVIKNGKVFSFTIDMGVDNANADIAGKTLKFVITPADHTAPLYSDADINLYTRKYFSEASSKTTVEKGDAVFLSVIATTNGGAIYTNTNAFLFVGDNSIFPGFDEWLIGKKAGSSTLNVTFSADAFTSDNALYLANGETVDFYVNITKICDTDIDFASDDFTDVWQMKEYCALSSFAEAYLYDTICTNTKVNTYPEAAYVIMEAEMRTQAEDLFEYYREYLEERLGDVSEEYIFNYMQKEVFGEESFESLDALVDGVVTDQMRYIIVNNVLADVLGIEYSYDEYEDDMVDMLASSGDYESSVGDVEATALGGRNYWYAYLLSGKVAQALSNKII